MTETRKFPVSVTSLIALWVCALVLAIESRTDPKTLFFSGIHLNGHTTEMPTTGRCVEYLAQHDRSMLEHIQLKFIEGTVRNDAKQCEYELRFDEIPTTSSYPTPRKSSFACQRGTCPGILSFEALQTSDLFLTQNVLNNTVVKLKITCEDDQRNLGYWCLSMKFIIYDREYFCLRTAEELERYILRRRSWKLFDVPRIYIGPVPDSQRILQWDSPRSKEKLHFYTLNPGAGIRGARDSDEQARRRPDPVGAGSKHAVEMADSGSSGDENLSRHPHRQEGGASASPERLASSPAQSGIYPVLSARARRNSMREMNGKTEGAPGVRMQTNVARNTIATPGGANSGRPARGGLIIDSHRRGIN